LNGFPSAPFDLGRVSCVDPKDPVWNLQGQGDQCADRQATRDFPRGMSTHPVGNHHYIVQFVGSIGHVAGRKGGHQRLQAARDLCDEELILVVFPAVAGMRQGADIDVDQRREGAVPRINKRSVSRG
jgi:hypothetical protein